MTHNALSVLPKISGPIPEEPYRTYVRQFLLKLYQESYALSTIKTYGWHMYKLGLWLTENSISTPDQVTPVLIIEWGSRSRTIYAPQTQKQCIVVTKAFFKFLSAMQYCREQVALDVDKFLAVPKVSTTLQRTFNATEVDVLFSNCVGSSRQSIRSRTLIALLLDTGLRAGELCRIKMTDIDFQNKKIAVIGKGGKQEFVYFSQKCQDALDEWLVIREKISKCDSLFVSMGGLTPGQSLTTRGLRSILKKIGEKSGVEDVHPHAFRRSFATLRIKKKGQSTRGVQRLGRWRNLETFERYTQALMVDDEFAMDEANNYSLLGDYI
jgi:site-specific recombinase XerD